MNVFRVVAAVIVAGLPVLVGCAVGKLLGGMAQNYEYNLLIEVHPAYDGLENKTVAVAVDADLATLYEHPNLALTVAANVSRDIGTNVPGVTVVPVALVADWQFRTPQWNAMPYGDVAKALKVDRVVYIDLYEYRLNPRGNQWLWEGICAANVGLIESDAIDPDSYVETFNVESSFPDEKGVARHEANAAQIQTGLLARFVERTGWLFYRHLEPKHPDKYRPPPGGETRTLEDLD
ncbi:MAG: hypothetical protein ACYS0G_05745 [Planctomycetota bacterium]|jgi:hypothetical protein